MRRALLVLTTALLTACVHGTLMKDLRPAHTPEGAQLRLRVADDRRFHTGELFAVDSSGLLLMSGRLVHVRFDRLRSLDFLQFGSGYDMFGGRLGAGQIERMKLVSRFPQGLDGAVLARVLVAVGQDAVQEMP